MTCANRDDRVGGGRYLVIITDHFRRVAVQMGMGMGMGGLWTNVQSRRMVGTAGNSNCRKHRSVGHMCSLTERKIGQLGSTPFTGGLSYLSNSYGVYESYHRGRIASMYILCRSVVTSHICTCQDRPLVTLAPCPPKIPVFHVFRPSLLSFQ